MGSFVVKPALHPCHSERSEESAGHQRFFAALRMTTRGLRGTLFCLVCLLLLSSCSLGSSSPSGTATPVVAGDLSPLPSPAPEDLQSLVQTEQLLLMTPHPLLNPYSLLQRLKSSPAIPTASPTPTLSPTPTPPVGRTTPLKEHVGQEDSFWLYNASKRSYGRVRAQLVAITPHL